MNDIFLIHKIVFHKKAGFIRYHKQKIKCMKQEPTNTIPRSPANGCKNNISGHSMTPNTILATLKD